MGDSLQPAVSTRPQVELVQIRHILSEFYGLEGATIKKMNGYDDLNFHIVVENLKSTKNPYVEKLNQDGYTLKITNSLDSKNSSLFEAQNQLLLFLGDHGICCPKPVRTIRGEYYIVRRFTSGNHIVRLFEFISGAILHEVPSSQKLCFQAGEYIAQLDRTLENFHHPVYEEGHFQSLWRLESVPEILKFHFAIKDDFRQKIVEEVVAEFQKRVLPMSVKLARGQIHGDFNEQNILVAQHNSEWFIKGVLDLGDSHFTCYLFELAIAMTYVMLQGKCVDLGGMVLAGYNSIRKIPQEEFDLLRVCVTARLCQSLVLGAYSSLHDPDNSYILTTQKSGWALLEELWSQPEKQVLEMWKKHL